MVTLLSDYIITPMAEGVDPNIESILAGESAIQLHNDAHGTPLHTPVIASLLDADKYLLEGYTLFESLCIKVAEKALEHTGIDAASERCVFVVSSTKGDIWESIAVSATRVAKYFNNSQEPVVVSAACTSGVCAQLTAYRLIEAGMYDTAVVIGCDVQSDFIISGFECLNAIDHYACKPFDLCRGGLNLGDAAACMVLSKWCSNSGWRLAGGSIHNDANHISGPSRTAEGSLRCLQDMLSIVPAEALACVSLHGTGTAYNDEMESIAIHRAGMDGVPVSALKGNYGHTMGAAGILECILSIHAIDRGLILPVKGYLKQGTTYALNISNEARGTEAKSFIKLLSGFGGINAALLWSKDATQKAPVATLKSVEVIDSLELRNDDLASGYKRELGDYPKFFKMDLMSKAGWLGAELLLKRNGARGILDAENTVVIIASRSGSLCNDINFNKTIADKANYYPSPSLFVYTLPNIVAGEIAIKEHIYGETASYILSDKSQLDAIVAATAAALKPCQIIAGWVECRAADDYEVDIKLIKTKETI